MPSKAIARSLHANRAEYPARPLFRLSSAAALGFSVLILAAVALALTAAGQQRVSPAPTAHFANGGNAAEVPMELASNAVFVPVQVSGGRPSNWLLDTAAPATAADPSTYPQAAPAGDAGDSATLALPGVEFAEPNLSVESFAPLGPWYGLRVSGIIGDDLLTGLVAELDYARLSIELYDPASYHQPGHMEKLPVRWVNRLPTFRAKVQLGGRTIDGNFVLNTGAAYNVLVFESFLSKERNGTLPGKSIPGEAIDGSGEQAATLIRGDSVDLGSFRISKPIVAIAGRTDSSSPAAGEVRKGDSVAGEIGGEILRKFRVVLDFPENCVFLAPNREFVFPLQADASGATITAAGDNLNQFEVRSVRPGSPAAQAGLQPGDRIVLIDGEEASDFSLDQIRDLFREAGHSPVLVVERMGRKVRIDLNLQPAI